MVLNRFGMLVAALAVSAFAATEMLFSNSAFSVAPGPTEGSLWVLSRGDVASGMTLMNLKVGNGGSVQVVNSKQEVLAAEQTAVQDGIFTDALAEHRRIPTAIAGNLGLVLPRFGEDGDGHFLTPEGFFSVRRLDGKSIYDTPFENLPESVAELDTAMDYAVSGFAYDSSKSVLWIASGVAGLISYDISKGTNSPKESFFVFDSDNKKLVALKKSSSENLKKYTPVFDVALHPETKELWLATAKGLWIYSDEGSLRSASKLLDTMRVTGVWIGGSPVQVIAETSKRVKESVKGDLFRQYGKAKEFAKVDFLDTAKKVVKKNVYDNADYTVSDIAFVGAETFVCVRAVDASVSGFLKLDSLGARAYEGDDGNAWLYGFNMGVTDRDVNIVSMTSFPMPGGITALAVATYGNGISVSADTGKTWTPILNRAKLSDNLGTIRMVPSVIVAGNESLVSYKVAKESKITIEVFSYDMKKVRRIVKSAPRSADASRSTNAKEDFWDGKDDQGRPCTMGVYYVRVKDNHGHVGWGKVMTLGGNKR